MAAMFAMLLAIILSACSPNTVAYKGLALTEKESGINVTSDTENKIIAVTSAHDNFSLILPYSTDWGFSWRDGYLLMGNAGTVNVTLSATISDKTAEQYISKLKQTLDAPEALIGLESSNMIIHRGDPVLVTVVNSAVATSDEDLSGIRHLNVFSARRWKNALYMLHISAAFVTSSEEEKLKNEYMDYATAGFSVSYMRDFRDALATPEVEFPWRRGTAKRR